MQITFTLNLEDPKCKKIIELLQGDNTPQAANSSSPNVQLTMNNMPPVKSEPMPVTPAPVQAPATTHVAETYTLDQLQLAGGQLMDAGRQQDLVAALAEFGVQSLLALPQEQYAAFAGKLRALGARL